METSASAVSTSSCFVSWEEAYVPSDQGRRKVYYYLNRKDGSSDLAIVGRERSLPDMPYHYSIPNPSLLSNSPSLSTLKLRSRKDVVEWLDSTVSGIYNQMSKSWLRASGFLCPQSRLSSTMSFHGIVIFGFEFLVVFAAIIVGIYVDMYYSLFFPHYLLHMPSFVVVISICLWVLYPFLAEQLTSNYFWVNSGSHMLADASVNTIHYRIRSNGNAKIGHNSADFSWVGVPWTCKKRRTHYQSFCRNNVKISAHDIVYVLAEENKRLVAHLDDMYEDSRQIKMVVVQWFHKIDEVGMVFPQNFNNREVFFSLCVQHLSIECIDGLASVLSPLHFDKFSKMTKHDSLEPFLCQKLFDNGEIKPFNITQLKGYWRQAIIGHLYSNHVSNDHLKSLTLDNYLKEETPVRPKKKLCQSREIDICIRSENESSRPDCLTSSKMGSENSRMMEAAVVSTEDDGKDVIVMKPLQPYVVGSAVEVLSQDSGIRGCWFRSVVIKKHKNKVKVRYLDLKDAEDESKFVEEWVLALKIAKPDVLGVRLSERTVVRPSPTCKKGITLLDTKVGRSVDVWWHDGWWEGIILQKYSEDKILIYFPGEKKESVFNLNDLRHSREWLVCQKWEDIKERSDLATSILSSLKNKENLLRMPNDKLDCALPCVNVDFSIAKKSSECLTAKKVEVDVCDLSKDALLAKLKWNSSGKRSRVNYHHKKMWSINKSSRESAGARDLRKFFDNALDDNCKFLGESRFSSSVVPMTNLVMSM